MKNSESKTELSYLPSVGRLLGFANRAATKLSEQRLAVYDLTLQQWIMLTALWQNDCLTVNQLAAYSRVKEPTASGIIDRLEGKEIVVRERSLKDRRKVIVCLTKNGKSLAHLIDFYEHINDALLSDFSKKEVVLFQSMMERIMKNAEVAVGSDSK